MTQKPRVLSKIARDKRILTKLKTIWRVNRISIGDFGSFSGEATAVFQVIALFNTRQLLRERISQQNLSSYSRQYLLVKPTLKEITSQTDQYLVILSSKTYVFEDKMTTFKSV